MKCEECQINIEEFFDGELKDGLAATVKSHIAACNECAALWDDLQREQEIYLRYQRDIEITPALWAGIETRITTEKVVVPPPSLFDRVKSWLGSTLAAPRMSFAYTAAVVLIAVGATVAVMSYINSRGKDNNLVAVDGGHNQQPNDSTNKPSNNAGDNDKTGSSNNLATGKNADSSEHAVTTPAPRRDSVRVAPKPKAQPTPEQLVREAEQKYLAAIAILTKDVNKRRSELDPVVAARFNTALAAIDRTIEETRQAARRNPNDPVALQYMLSAYAKKVEVLRDIADD